MSDKPVVGRINQLVMGSGRISQLIPPLKLNTSPEFLKKCDELKDAKAVLEEFKFVARSAVEETEQLREKLTEIRRQRDELYNLLFMVSPKHDAWSPRALKVKAEVEATK